MTQHGRSAQKTSASCANRTGAGMMDCKKALEETGGDMDKAVELLRSKGAAKAEKRSGRQTKEGMIAQLHPPQRQDRRAGGAELRDRLRRAHRRLPAARASGSPSTSPRPRRWRSTRIRCRPEKVESERRIFVEQVKAEGKPEHMIDKIVEGKIQAYYKDVALLHQAWVREPKKTIGDLVKEVSAKTGENVQVRRFVRYQLGRVRSSSSRALRAAGGSTVTSPDAGRGGSNHPAARSIHTGFVRFDQRDLLRVATSA